MACFWHLRNNPEGLAGLVPDLKREGETDESYEKFLATRFMQWLGTVETPNRWANAVTLFMQLHHKAELNPPHLGHQD